MPLDKLAAIQLRLDAWTVRLLLDRALTYCRIRPTEHRKLLRLSRAGEWADAALMREFRLSTFKGNVRLLAWVAEGWAEEVERLGRADV